MSLLTGLYPITHQVRFANDVLSDLLPTLAEILAASGYQTGAVTENAMLLAETGFAFGFDSYFENKGLGIWSTEGQIDSTLARGRRWLREHAGERFFLFPAHLPGAHAVRAARRVHGGAPPCRSRPRPRAQMGDPPAPSVRRRSTVLRQRARRLPAGTRAHRGARRFHRGSHLRPRRRILRAWSDGPFEERIRRSASGSAPRVGARTHSARRPRRLHGLARST